MKKLSIVCLAVVMAVAFGFTAANADPSAKVTAKCGDISVIDMAGDATDYTTIFTQTIKTAQQKDLFIGVSLECGLTTNTKVASKTLVKATAEAEAVVKVQVLVDGTMDGNEVALPGEIIFARRHQKLIAEFAGDITGCIDTLTGTIVIDETCVLPETLQLILNTMSANSFNFIVKDLLAGPHTIQVQAKLIYVDGDADEIYDTAETGAMSNAYLGMGSVTIEEVRMIKDEDVEL